MLILPKIKSFLHKSQKQEWKHFLRHEDSPAQLFRTYNPEVKCENAKDALTFIYLTVVLAGLLALIKLPAAIYFILLWLEVAVLFVVLSQIQLFAQRRKREEQGRKTEEEIAKTLWESFRNHGVSLYSALDLEHSVLDDEYFDSRLYIERNKDLDIFAVFPSGESFKILVSSWSGATITFNENNETLRYAYSAKNRGKINPEPLQELLSSERWLLFNRPQLVKQPSTKMLVFVGASLADHNQYLYENWGGQKFLRVWRENQPVYVVTTKEEVCQLIATHLNSKTRKKRLGWRCC